MAGSDPHRNNARSRFGGSQTSAPPLFTQSMPLSWSMKWPGATFTLALNDDLLLAMKVGRKWPSVFEAG
jgi:hypothetical protein